MYMYYAQLLFSSDGMLPECQNADTFPYTEETGTSATELPGALDTASATNLLGTFDAYIIFIRLDPFSSILCGLKC